MQILYIKRKGYETWLKWSTLHLDHTWLFRVRITTTVHEAIPHGNVWRSVWEICMWLKGLNGGYKQTQGYMKGEFSRFMLFPCLKHPAFKFQHMCNQIWQSIKSLRLSYCSCRDGCCMIYPSHVSLIAWRCSWLPLADKTPMTKSYVGRADNLPWSIQKKKQVYSTIDPALLLQRIFARRGCFKLEVGAGYGLENSLSMHYQTYFSV